MGQQSNVQSHSFPHASTATEADASATYEVQVIA